MNSLYFQTNESVDTGYKMYFIHKVQIYSIVIILYAVLESSKVKNKILVHYTSLRRLDDTLSKLNVAIISVQKETLFTLLLHTTLKLQFLHKVTYIFTLSSRRIFENVLFAADMIIFRTKCYVCMQIMQFYEEKLNLH